jgi:4,4'-diaponeurosporenoate glycosyltransferase
LTTAFIIAAAVSAFIAIAAMALLFFRLRKLPIDASNKSSVSIIIPARNEERNLALLLPSLRDQTVEPLEIIVVDDQSSDATAAIAEAHHCRVVRSADLPPGWYGKPWACQQGAAVALGDQLFFLDADVVLERSTLARLTAHSNSHPNAVISICPWHRTEKPYEQLSVFFNLLMVGGIGAFTIKGDQAAGIGLFGQTMWIPKSIYQQIGGHESVRKTILENLHLAGALERLGIPRHCFIGKGSITMRMFPEGFRELSSSWTKGFSSGASLTSPFAMTLAAIWLSGLMAISIILFLLPLAETPAHLPVIGCYLLVAAALWFLFQKIGRFTLLNALLFPIALFFYQSLFALAIIRKRRGTTTQWKGRHVA